MTLSSNQRLNLESSCQFERLTVPSTALFGTDGIRGKVGEFLNAPLALQIGFWAGQVLQETSQGPVILGQDSRNSSDMLATAIVSGLTLAGLDVWQLGLCPTPCVAYLTKAKKASGGIMISASHNPPEDNGIKFFSHNGTKLATKQAQTIEARLREADPRAVIASSRGKFYRHPALVKDYVDSLRRSLPTDTTFAGMRIVLDLAWGASVALAPSIFAALGAEIICLHNQPNGDRINVNCGSTHLGRLQNAVKEYQADLGWAFDGDADRAMAVDAQGRVVDGDYILYLWGSLLKKQHRLPERLIVATVMANLGFERAWRQIGGQMLRTPVGDQHVQSQMWQTGAMLGGEQSGHIICHHHGVSGDGIQTALQLTALVQQSGTTLAELVEQSFHTYPQLLKNVRVEERHRSRWQECEPLQKAIAQAEAEMGDEGRILVRASGTEPVIRVMVEAAERASAVHWSQQLVTTVQQHLG